VYDAISSDYTLLSMRTHYPPLSAYSEPKSAPFDPVVFSEIIKQGFDAKKHIKLIESSVEFNRFVDLITERSPDQERWVDGCRKDKWKDVALFLGLNYKENPSFYRLLKVVSEKDDVSKLNKHMLDFKTRDTQSLGREMTAFIQSIALPVEFCEEILSSLVLRTTKEHVQKEEAIKEEITKEKALILFHSNAEYKMEDLRERMEPYRKRAGLTAVVDTQRIARQMVYSSLGEDFPPEILTKTQKTLTPIQGEEEQNLVLDIIQSEAFDEDSLKELTTYSEKANRVVRVTNKREWDTRALLQHAIQPEKFLDERTIARLNKIK